MSRRQKCKSGFLYTTACLRAVARTMKAPTNTSCTPTSVTLQFTAVPHDADEYRVEYTEHANPDFDEGKRVQRNETRTNITLTQGLLRPNTRYTFRIVPYRDGVRGRPSHPLTASTSKHCSHTSQLLFTSSLYEVRVLELYRVPYIYEVWCYYITVLRILLVLLLYRV